MSTEKHVYPGDLTKFQVKVDGTTITNMTTVVEIYQDLFTPTWSAQLTVSDTQNLIMNVPIKPGSKVEITVETQAPEPCQGTKTFTFFVYKISDRIMVKQEHQGYVVHCVTEEFYKNQKTRIQKAYQSKNPIDIVKDCVAPIGGKVEADTDGKTYDVIVSNWSPFTAVAWVSRFTVNPRSGADFLFYQSDIGGKFKYRSMEKMFMDKSSLVLTVKNPNIKEDESGHRQDTKDFVAIQSWEFITHHDVMRNYTMGYYASKVISHDIIKKKVNTTKYTYGMDNEDDKTKRPFDGEFFDEVHDSHISFVPFHQGVKNGMVPNENYMSWHGSRNSNIMKLEENRLIVTVPGFVCGYEYLGKQCEVELPSMQDLKKSEKLDTYLKGDYLITAIRHTIAQDAYSITFELGKKRLAKSYE